MPPVQLQFRETNATLPDTYVLPPDMELELASVKARIDGAGASGTFIPCLAILSQDGKLMARVRIDQEFAVADTGDCTWAPFLKRAAAATPSGAFVSTFIDRERTTAQTIANAAWTQVQIGTGTTTNTDATRFAINGVDADATNILKTGIYGIKAQLHWDAPFAGLTNMKIVDGYHGWAYGVDWEEAGGAAGAADIAPILYCVRFFPSGTTSLDFQVRQQSGGNQDIESSSLTLTYVGDYSGQPSTADNY